MSEYHNDVYSIILLFIKKINQPHNKLSSALRRTMGSEVRRPDKQPCVIIVAAVPRPGQPARWLSSALRFSFFWRGGGGGCWGTTGLHGNKIITSLLSSCCRLVLVFGPSSAAARLWLHTLISHTTHTHTRKKSINMCFDSSRLVSTQDFLCKITQMVKNGRLMRNTFNGSSFLNVTLCFFSFFIR